MIDFQINMKLINVRFLSVNKAGVKQRGHGGCMKV